MTQRLTTDALGGEIRVRDLERHPDGQCEVCEVEGVDCRPGERDAHQRQRGQPALAGSVRVARLREREPTASRLAAPAPSRTASAAVREASSARARRAVAPASAPATEIQTQLRIRAPRHRLLRARRPTMTLPRRARCPRRLRRFDDRHLRAGIGRYCAALPTRDLRAGGRVGLRGDRAAGATGLDGAFTDTLAGRQQLTLGPAVRSAAPPRVTIMPPAESRRQRRRNARRPRRSRGHGRSHGTRTSVATGPDAASRR